MSLATCREHLSAAPLLSPRSETPSSLVRGPRSPLATSVPRQDRIYKTLLLNHLRRPPPALPRGPGAFSDVYRHFFRETVTNLGIPWGCGRCWPQRGQTRPFSCSRRIPAPGRSTVRFLTRYLYCSCDSFSTEPGPDLHRRRLEGSEDRRAGAAPGPAPCLGHPVDQPPTQMEKPDASDVSAPCDRSLRGDPSSWVHAALLRAASPTRRAGAQWPCQRGRPVYARCRTPILAMPWGRSGGPGVATAAISTAAPRHPG